MLFYFLFLMCNTFNVVCLYVWLENDYSSFKYKVVIFKYIFGLKLS